MVITIILIVSAVALPTVLPALSHRQVSEAARNLQAVLAGPATPPSVTTPRAASGCCLIRSSTGSD